MILYTFLIVSLLTQPLDFVLKFFEKQSQEVVISSRGSLNTTTFLRMCTGVCHTRNYSLESENMIAVFGGISVETTITMVLGAKEHVTWTTTEVFGRGTRYIRLWIHTQYL